MSYYVDMDGKTAGPFSLAEVGDLFRAGRLSRASLYARPGSHEWLPLGTIEPLLAPAPEPPVAPPAPLKPVAKRSDVICLSCGAITSGVTRVKGSFVVEIALWLLFCAPGLIYTLWRSTSRHRVCGHCHGTNIIPADSPQGRQIVSFADATKDRGPGWSAKFGGWCGRKLRAARHKGVNSNA